MFYTKSNLIFSDPFPVYNFDPYQNSWLINRVLLANLAKKQCKRKSFQHKILEEVKIYAVGIGNVCE